MRQKVPFVTLYSVALSAPLQIPTEYFVSYEHNQNHSAQEVKAGTIWLESCFVFQLINVWSLETGLGGVRAQVG